MASKYIQFDRRTHWINNETRLNAANMNNLTQGLIEVVNILEDENGNGMIRDVNELEQIVRKDYPIDFTDKPLVEQAEIINRLLYGNDYESSILFDVTAEKQKSADVLRWINEDYNNTSSRYCVDGNSINPFTGLGLANKTYEFMLDASRRLDTIQDKYNNYGVIFSPNYSIRATEDTTNPTKQGSGPLNWKGLSINGSNISIPLTIDTGSKLVIGGFQNSESIDITGKHILPSSTDTHDLGDSTNRWLSVFAQNFLGDSVVTKQLKCTDGEITNLTVTNSSGFNLKGSIIPDKKNTYTLGSTDKVFKTGYFNSVETTYLTANNSQLQVLNVSTSADIGTDEEPLQGTNKSSVVVYKTLKDEEARSLAAEKVLTDNLANEVKDRIDDVDAEQGRAEKAEQQLATDLANETANRTAADEKITAAYTTKDAELQTNIDAINLALSYLADKDVITAEPSFKFSSSNVTTVEVGTNITPNFKITFDDGAYEYGPDPTGSEASGYEVTFNGESLDTAEGNFAAVHVTDSTSLTLSAKCTYTDGSTPKNNLGLDYVAGKIVGATKTITRTLKGYRQAFAGGSESKDVTVSDISSNDIRALVAKGNGKKTFDVAINASDIRVLIAFPSSWGSLKSVLDVNDSNKNIVSAFGSATIVSVSGATADEDMMDYKLYVMDFASAYGSEGNTYKVTIG